MDFKVTYFHPIPPMSAHGIVLATQDVFYFQANPGLWHFAIGKTIEEAQDIILGKRGGFVRMLAFPATMTLSVPDLYAIFTRAIHAYLQQHTVDAAVLHLLPTPEDVA